MLRGLPVLMLSLATGCASAPYAGRALYDHHFVDMSSVAAARSEGASGLAADDEPSQAWLDKMVRPCVQVGTKMNC
jgi:hypothetical protein